MPSQTPDYIASYTLDGKTTGISFEEGSKEAVIVLPAESLSKTVTLSVNRSSTQKALVVGVNKVSVGDYTVKFVVPLESVKLSASLSEIKLSTTSGAAVTGKAILNFQVEDDFSGFMADPDFIVSYEWKQDGVLQNVHSAHVISRVDVRVEGDFVICTEPESFVVVKVIHSEAGEILAMQSNSIEGDIRERRRPNDFLSYIVSGGELTEEIKGEIELEAPGNWNDEVKEDYTKAYIVALDSLSRGATVTATLLSTGETVTAELDMLDNCLEIGKYDGKTGEYKISFISLTDTEIPTAISAQYNVIQNIEGGDAEVEVTLSARFAEPDALNCEGGVYGIRWHNSSGNVIGQASWHSYNSSWRKGGCEEWSYSCPYSVSESEDGKVVNCKCILKLSEVPNAEDLKGYYAYVFYEMPYTSIGDHWVWLEMLPKLVIKDVTEVNNE